LFQNIGASLQEITISIIHFRSDKNANRPMGVKNVDEKHLPIRITTYFGDDSGNCVSSENIVIADSTSKETQHRAYKEKFTLKNMEYDKGKNYFLVIKDEEDIEEIERIRFVIDLVFHRSVQS
jgi:hypothetical protein